MISARVIARLDIKGPNVIKGIHLEGLRVVGKPGDLARKYYQEGADEILFMDVVASLYERNSILPIVADVGKNVFVPLTVGGGIRTQDDIVAALRAGADKVAINTAAINRPAFISEAAEVFGSQCIVVSIEAKELPGGGWEALTNNGRERTGVDALEWAARAEQLGAGEILVTSVDQEGTRRGISHPLMQAIRRRVSLPVIAAGGVGAAQDMIKAFRDDDVDAVACAGVLHYNLCTLPGLKADMRAAGLEVRL